MNSNKGQELTYTKEQLAIMAELGVLSNKILNMEFPRNTKFNSAVAQARKYAAQELHRLGYSTREVASALGLKSPQSVQKYLKDNEL